MWHGCMKHCITASQLSTNQVPTACCSFFFCCNTKPIPFHTQGLYSASAGTFPAGSVMGCAGHNAAGCVVRDLGLQPWWPTA